MNEITYRKLQQHLDQLPDGFPPSSSGDADLRLLEKLFTPQEAELAVHLTLDREPVQVIAERAGLPLEVAQSRLDEMAVKGLIFAHEQVDGSHRYQAAPMVVGIYELQINKMDLELLSAFIGYWGSAVERPSAGTIPQLRTIPVGESIARHPEALPYEQVEMLVAENDSFAVATCICRHNARLVGAGCQAPTESCLIFGEWANFYARTGRGRLIDRAEVMSILVKADQANLVLQPSNSQEVEFICTCCGCCCGVLGGIKKHPRPADVVASAYIAHLDEETCEACWTCLERCQMDALVENGTYVKLKSERCIGCGLCVSTCSSGALTLQRKPASVLTEVPATFDDTWKMIARGPH